MKLTIFTPTYNRSGLLQRLQESLLKQTDMDFEWVLVDDGSTDNTAETVAGWGNQPFSFKYIRVPNRGKHIAINIGVKNAVGEYFFIVDSDDWLLPNAVEKLKELIDKTPQSEEFAGFATNRLYPDGTANGNEVKYEVLDTDFITYSNRYHYTGEKPSCLRTSVWRKFPFPEYEGERFCSEALVLRRMARKYKVRFYNTAVYVMEGYLSDGLTSSLRSHFLASPSYSTLLFKEQFPLPYTSLKYKLATVYNYWKYYSKAPKKTAELKPDFALASGYPVYLLASIYAKFRKK